MNVREIVLELKKHASEKNRLGMARFGINPTSALGVSIPVLREIAKKHKRQHLLAAELWATQIHEARILAALIDDPKQVTEKQMEEWVEEFNSWDLCDQACGNLFDKTAFAYEKAIEWSSSKKEFVKRAGFALMACLAVHDKKASNTVFESFLPLIERESSDERNFVKKAVNWSLRQIGKRNPELNKKALKLARKLKESDSKPARWIGSDAVRELEKKF
ncbi:DNA alkylation repair protein [Candidatus Micrarchaeota archaeon]|nr:DNA alkylation repair protein [Candidatus Micrarchaeota archaeon]